MNIVFMGTPDFALGVLKSICESQEHNVTLVVTQPDRPKGRSGKMVASPVKTYALEQGIEVFQPERIKREEAVEKLREYQADIFVVAAFGQILSKEILDMPRFGCINVHASLLPEYRGAAPIQWAIADGRRESGVTIMQMNEGLDTGDILTRTVVPITSKETGESLFDKLMEAGATLLINTLDMIEHGSIQPVKQDEAKASYAKILKKEMGRVDFGRTAAEIDCLIRAFTPWPGGYTYLDGKVIKIKKAEPYNGELEPMEAAPSEFRPGQIARVTKDEVYVKCQEGYLVLKEIQPEGKKAMSVHDYLLGKKLSSGQEFS